MLRLLWLSQHLDIVVIRSHGRNPSGFKPQEATTTTLCNCGNCKPLKKLVLDEKRKGSAPKGDTLKPRLLLVFINPIPYMCFSRAFDRFAYDIFFLRTIEEFGVWWKLPWTDQLLYKGKKTVSQNWLCKIKIGASIKWRATSICSWTTLFLSFINDLLEMIYHIESLRLRRTSIVSDDEGMSVCTKTLNSLCEEN